MLSALAHKWNILLMMALLPAVLSILCKHNWVWREHVSRKNTCLAQTLWRGPKLSTSVVWEQKIIFSLVLAQGVFSPAVDLRFLLCPWARVYFKVAVKHVRTDSQDLGVEMLKTWSVLLTVEMCSQVPAMRAAPGAIICSIYSVLRIRMIQAYVSEK